jgi:predicted tellurium resistance membrane protein TerC
VGGILVYFALVFAILWVSFIINAFRVRGLARFRMVAIAGGFFLLFVAIGLIPRLLFGKIPSQTAQDLTTTVGYIALASAPLLLFGFTPPTWLNKSFGPAAP